MKTVLFACFMLFGVALAIPSQEADFARSAQVIKYAADNFESLSTRQKIETINEFVDMALTELRFLVIRMKMDPMSLPNVSQGFTGGSLDMANGLLEGISQIFRDGDVVLIYEDRTLDSDVSLMFNNFQLDYDYGVKVWGIKSDGKLNGTVKNIKLNFKIDVDFQNLHITLDNFSIHEIEDISVNFEGGVIGSIANVISGLVTSLFKGMITDMLSSAIGDTLVKVIDQVNEVLEGIKNPPPPPPEPILFNFKDFVRTY